MAVDDAEAAVIGSQVLTTPPEAAHTRAHHTFNKQRHIINVALIGNPNCGKTSIFNAASGAREHVGNYSGVTVDAKDIQFKFEDYTFNFVDLPGTYSLTCYSPEELYVRQYLRENTPDVIINVVDSSNLERNLYLTTELIDMDCPMVIALNMYDELGASGARLNYEELGKMIGVPMVPVVSKTGEGIGDLLERVIAVYEGRDKTVRHIHVNLGPDIEGAVRKLVDEIKASPSMRKHFSPRYLAIKLLEGDHEIEDEIPAANRSDNKGRKPGFWQKLIGKPNKREPRWRQHLRIGANDPIMLLRDKLRAKIENLHDQDISSIVAAEKYGFVAGALAETYKSGNRQKGKASAVLDKLATNRWLGFPIFLAIMIFIFWATFAIGSYPMEWIENGVAWLASTVQKLMPDGPLKDLVSDGIIGGVGGVIVFLPNILILFFCISFMEDSGYMARAAFIMDKLMHRIGLHGKSFIPPGNGLRLQRARSACLAKHREQVEPHYYRTYQPLHVVLCPTADLRANVRHILRRTRRAGHGRIVFRRHYNSHYYCTTPSTLPLQKDETPFVMELPPYRLPTFKASMNHTWSKGKQYLKKMGGIILFASVIVWALNYFPLHNGVPSTEIHSTSDTIDPERDSYLEMTGKMVNPVMKPLGFNWRATVAAMAGVPAKEIVVSTLGVLYTNDEEVSDSRLGVRLQAISPISGKPDFTPAVALAFMVFILLYCPCIATITAIARETGSWRYAAFSVIYNTAIAWLLAFATYHIALLI